MELGLSSESNIILTFRSITYRGEDQPVDNGGEAPPGGLSDADIDSNWDEAIETFDGMEIPEELLRGIYAYGFEKPSAIQQRAIKPTTLGRDLIAQAQSGTVSCQVRRECERFGEIYETPSHFRGGSEDRLNYTIFRVLRESPSTCGETQLEI